MKTSNEFVFCHFIISNERPVYKYHFGQKCVVVQSDSGEASPESDQGC